MIDYAGKILAETVEEIVTRQAGLCGDGIDLIGAQGTREIAGRNWLVLALADPRIGGIALAALLQLLHEVAEAAGKNAAGRTAGKQAAEAALEHIAQAAAIAGPGIDGLRRGGWSRGGRGARLAAAKMLDRFPGEQRQDRHCHRRHAAAGIRSWVGGAARAVL